VNRGSDKVAFPLVSVIVTAYNQAAMLRQTLESVLKQSYRPIECIVVDDGSTDHTPDVVSWFQSDSNFQFRYIFQANQGVQNARNRGLGECRGDFIQFLDGDDLLAPGKLAAQIAHFASHEHNDIDVIYGDAIILREQNANDINKSVIGLGPVEDMVVGLLNGKYNANFSYLCRRKAVDMSGPWNPELRINQDFEFFLKIACKGGHFEYVPGLTGTYRQHSAGRISSQSMLLRARATTSILRATEELARTAGQLTPQRKRAFAEAYRNVSCWAFGLDQAVWRECIEHAVRVYPAYRARRVFVRAVHRVLGIELGEAVIGHARLMKAQIAGRVAR
jgi:glycosyltransferase involved in cell wall biosynthesis